MMLHFLPPLFRPKNRGSVYCVYVVYEAGHMALNMLELAVLNHVFDLMFDMVASTV